MPGRPKKPTAVKKAQGTAQPCRMQKNEMLPARIDGLPAPPEALKNNKHAMKLWMDSVLELEKLNMLHFVDLPALGAYCMEMSNYFSLTAYCEKNGYVDMKTGKRRSQDIVRRDSLDRAIRLAQEFGFVPAARTKISMPDKGKYNNNLFDE